MASATKGAPLPAFTNPPATIDVHEHRVTRIVAVQAPPEHVWMCITEPTHIAEWLGDIAAFPDGVTEGAQGRFAWTGEVVLAAKIVTVDAPHVFAFDWSEGILGDNATNVTFSLRPTDDGTSIHFQESGFQLDGGSDKVRGSLRALAQGWTVELDELVAYAEATAA